MLLLYSGYYIFYNLLSFCFYLSIQLLLCQYWPFYCYVFTVGTVGLLRTMFCEILMKIEHYSVNWRAKLWLACKRRLTSPKGFYSLGTFLKVHC